MSSGKHKPRMVNINVYYLEAVIAKSGKSDSEFGQSLGFSRGYVTSVEKSKQMRLATAKSLCLMHDADYNKLVLPEKVEQPEGPKPLYADDKTLSGIIETLMRIEKKLDRLYDEFH